MALHNICDIYDELATLEWPYRTKRLDFLQATKEISRRDRLALDEALSLGDARRESERKQLELERARIAKLQAQRDSMTDREVLWAIYDKLADLQGRL